MSPFCMLFLGFKDRKPEIRQAQDLSLNPYTSAPAVSLHSAYSAEDKLDFFMLFLLLFGFFFSF